MESQSVEIIIDGGGQVEPDRTEKPKATMSMQVERQNDIKELAERIDFDGVLQSFGSAAENPEKPHGWGAGFSKSNLVYHALNECYCLLV